VHVEVGNDPVVLGDGELHGDRELRQVDAAGALQVEEVRNAPLVVNHPDRRGTDLEHPVVCHVIVLEIGVLRHLHLAKRLEPEVDVLPRGLNF
jgi:hypothetical protein